MWNKELEAKVREVFDRWVSSLSMTARYAPWLPVTDKPIFGPERIERMWTIVRTYSLASLGGEDVDLTVGFRAGLAKAESEFVGGSALNTLSERLWGAPDSPIGKALIGANLRFSAEEQQVFNRLILLEPFLNPSAVGEAKAAQRRQQLEGLLLALSRGDEDMAATLLMGTGTWLSDAGLNELMLSYPALFTEAKETAKKAAAAPPLDNLSFVDLAPRMAMLRKLKGRELTAAEVDALSGTAAGSLFGGDDPDVARVNAYFEKEGVVYEVGEFQAIIEEILRDTSISAAARDWLQKNRGKLWDDYRVKSIISFYEVERDAQLRRRIEQQDPQAALGLTLREHDIIDPAEWIQSRITEELPDLEEAEFLRSTKAGGGVTPLTDLLRRLNDAGMGIPASWLERKSWEGILGFQSRIGGWLNTLAEKMKFDKGAVFMEIMNPEWAAEETKKSQQAEIDAEKAKQAALEASLDFPKPGMPRGIDSLTPLMQEAIKQRIETDILGLPAGEQDIQRRIAALQLPEALMDLWFSLPKEQREVEPPFIPPTITGFETGEPVQRPIGPPTVGMQPSAAFAGMWESLSTQKLAKFTSWLQSLDLGALMPAFKKAKKVAPEFRLWPMREI